MPISSPFTVRQIVIKKPGDNWNGIFVGDLRKSVSSTPDPRDLEGSENTFTLNKFKEEWSKQSKFSWSSYKWDREYVSENTLIFYFYFDDQTTAVDFYNWRNTIVKPVPDITKFKPEEGFVDKLEDLDPSNRPARYLFEWEIVDSAGNPVPTN